jgi:hypothetical protein
VPARGSPCARTGVASLGTRDDPPPPPLFRQANPLSPIVVRRLACVRVWDPLPRTAAPTGSAGPLSIQKNNNRAGAATGRTGLACCPRFSRTRSSLVRRWPVRDELQLGISTLSPRVPPAAAGRSRSVVFFLSHSASHSIG